MSGQDNHRRIWVDVTLNEDGIKWGMSARDEEWLAGLGWDLVLNELEDIAITDYAAYLQSERWQSRALAAKQKAGYRCQLCNAPRSLVALDTHHRTYERIGRERDGDLIVLCRTCHGIFHRSGRLAKA